MAPSFSTTVLVVDDTAAQRYLRTKALQSAGFRVIEAACGQDALDLATQADAILLDVHLPDIDGMEVCRRLRRRPETSSLAIIHISGVFIADADVKDGSEAGADAYLIEPVPTGVLVQVIQTTVAARRPPAAPSTA